MATFKLGINAALYLGDTELATLVGPTDEVWTEVTNIKDVTLNMSKGDADATTRANDGWTSTVGTLKDADISFTLKAQDSDTSFTSLNNSFLNSTTVPLAVMDGPIATAANQGLVANCFVTAVNRTESNDDLIWYEITVKPYDQQQWYTVAAS